jgi:hypothetical protein
MTQKLRLRQAARGERPRYFKDPAIDKLLSITLALTGEVAVMRDRIDTLERMLEAKQPITRSAIDNFQPTTEIRAARDAWRDAFLDVVLRSVRQELEGLELHRDQGTFAAAIELVEDG